MTISSEEYEFQDSSRLDLLAQLFDSFQSTPYFSNTACQPINSRYNRQQSLFPLPCFVFFNIMILVCLISDNCNRCNLSENTHCMSRIEGSIYIKSFPFLFYCETIKLVKIQCFMKFCIEDRFYHRQMRPGTKHNPDL